MLNAAIMVIFPLCMIYAAASDLLTMTIPNRISVVLIAAFLVIAPLGGVGLHEFGLHVLAAAIVFAACFALFAVNVMGGGDAKLLTAAALWYGYNASLVAFLASTALMGGLLTVVILILRWQSTLLLAARIPLPQTLLHAKKVPYGIAIAAGGLLTFEASPLMLRLLSGAA